MFSANKCKFLGDICCSQRGLIYLIAIAGSLLLSIINLHNYPIFNTDGLFYLNLATCYWDHGLKAAMLMYHWPFFSILIAYCSHILGISYLAAANLLVTVFATLLVVMFIRVMEELGAPLTVLWSALIVILLYHQFNSYRSSIIRDVGYWAFYLMALWLFIRFIKYEEIYLLIACWIALGIAGLFRVEGLVFLVSNVCLMVCYPAVFYHKKIKYLEINLLALCCVVVGAGLFLILRHNPIVADKIKTPIDQLKLVPASYQHILGVVRSSVVGAFGQEDAAMVLYSGILVNVIANIIAAFSVAFLFLFAYAFWRKVVNIPKKILLSLSFFVLVNLVIIAIFYSIQRFLSLRYVMALCLTLLCIVPYGLFELFRRWRGLPLLSVRNLLFPIIFLALCGALIGSVIPFGHSKANQYQAAKWVQKNTPANSQFYTNDKIIVYLGGRVVQKSNRGLQHFFTAKGASPFPWQSYDYLLYRYDAKHDAAAFQKIQSAIGQAPLKSFSGGRKSQDIVAIFKIK